MDTLSIFLGFSALFIFLVWIVVLIRKRYTRGTDSIEEARSERMSTASDPKPKFSPPPGRIVPQMRRKMSPRDAVNASGDTDTYRDTDNRDFLSSAVVAAATGSEVVGAIAGGSITGAIVGGMFNDESESPSEASWETPDTSSSYEDSSTDAWDSDSDSDWDD